MIAAMLLLIYQKVNNLAYKTAKRRIAMELRDEYRHINRFCRRGSRQSFQDIKMARFLPTKTIISLLFLWNKLIPFGIS